MKKNILVVGGAGYIGSHMVQALLEAKLKPIVFDNLSTGHKQFIPKNVTFIKGDLKNKSDLEKVFSKYSIEAVMHFAASSLVGESVQEPLKYYENNVYAAINLLNTMLTHRVHKFIFSSTAATYGEPKKMPITEEFLTAPINPYGRSKLMIETILADVAKVEKSFSYIVLRYFNVAGAHHSGMIGEVHEPETHLIPNVLKFVKGERKEFSLFGDDYPTADGTCVRDYIHVEDLAQAHLLALKALHKGIKNQIFNLGNGSGYSVKQVVRAVEEVLNQEIKVKVLPRRPGDPPKLIASYKKAAKILGWKPQRDLKRIVLDACLWEKLI